MSPTELFSQHQHKAHIIAYTFSQGLPAWVYLDDLYTAALVGIWDACQTWDPAKASLSTHIKYCTRRSIIDMMRQWYRKKGQKFYMTQRSMRPYHKPHWQEGGNEDKDDYYVQGGIVDHRRSPQQEYEDSDEIEAALRTVPKQHRELLKDYFLLGLTQQEIARKRFMWPSDVSRALAPYIKRAGTTRNYGKAA